jgi:hypothetical protein
MQSVVGHNDSSHEYGVAVGNQMPDGSEKAKTMHKFSPTVDPPLDEEKGFKCTSGNPWAPKATFTDQPSK